MCASQKKCCLHPQLMVQRYRTHIVSTNTLCFQNVAQNAARLKTSEQCKRFSHPVHPRAAHPSLCSVGVVWVGKQTADTLRYFLAPHQLSFSPRLLLISMCAPHSGCVLYFLPPPPAPFSPHLGNFLRWIIAHRSSGSVCPATSALRTTLVLIQWRQRTAAVRPERWQLFERPQPPGAVMFQWQTSGSSAANTQKRAADMSGGEILFQGWLRKSPPEKKLRRYVSIWDFCWVLLFSVLIDWWERIRISTLSLFCWTRASSVAPGW